MDMIANAMKPLVFTSANNDMSLMLLEWLVSLRHLAAYGGEIVVLDYGLTGRTRRALASFDATVIPCEERDCIVCDRYIDVIPLLLGNYRNHVVMHSDADIWFQSPIDRIFDLAISLSDGCVFSPDVGWFTQPSHVDEPLTRIYEEKVRLVRERYGGTIQGGFSCAAAMHLARKYQMFQEMITQGLIRREYGSDQFAFNWLFDPEMDCADAHLWNCIGTDAVLDDGVWYSRRNGRRQRINGLHVVGESRGDPTRLFRNNYPALLHSCIQSRDIAPEAAVELPSWGPLEHSNDVWAALCKVIVTCREHQGSAIAVGIPIPKAVFADVGCTSLVPLSHGHIHYWDTLGLPRKPHIRHPERLYFSRKAVDTLAGISLDEAWRICRMFERNWLDFMLTMLCAQNSLSWGPMWMA
jgi:hypothetical protein